MIRNVGYFLIVATMTTLLGFLVGKHQAKVNSIECRIDRVVLNEDAEVNTRGMKVPYTVCVYEPVFETHLIPGILGKPGGIVHIPKE